MMVQMEVACDSRGWFRWKYEETGSTRVHLNVLGEVLDLRVAVRRLKSGCSWRHKRYLEDSKRVQLLGPVRSQWVTKGDVTWSPMPKQGTTRCSRMSQGEEVVCELELVRIIREVKSMILQV